MTIHDDAYRGCVEENRTLEDVFKKARLARSVGVKLDAPRPPIRGADKP